MKKILNSNYRIPSLQVLHLKLIPKLKPSVLSSDWLILEINQLES